MLGCRKIKVIDIMLYIRIYGLPYILAFSSATYNTGISITLKYFYTLIRRKLVFI